MMWYRLGIGWNIVFLAINLDLGVEKGHAYSFISAALNALLVGVLLGARMGLRD